MSSWLVVGEPLISIRIPRVRFLNKEARLRARAEAYVDTNFRQFYGEKEEWRYQQNKRARVSTMLSERRSVLESLDGRGRYWSGSAARVPRWRPFLRRRMTRLICERSRVAKWW